MGMYLKSLEIHGFKSFAQQATFEFGRGVTGVVGPNGCGKSNVVDAIRWVLGETSAKALRGQDVVDVIFNGSETRKPSGLAAVTMVMAGCEEALGVDFHEVAITRKIFRDGKNEYLLNGKACRLRDIQDLLMDTGIGRSSYSIMEQGKIDLLLSSKPEDRRLVFEEAAGITKFKKEKREAQRKLEATEANLLRVKDSVDEQATRLKLLETQVSKAKAYRDQLRDIEVLDCHWAAHRYAQLSAGHSDQRASLQLLQNERQNLAKSLPEHEQSLEKGRQLQRQSAITIRSKEADLAKQKLAQSNAQTRAQLSSQWHGEWQERIAEERGAKEILEQGIAQRESELESELTQLAADKMAWEALQKSLHEQEKEQWNRQENQQRLLRETSAVEQGLNHRITELAAVSAASEHAANQVMHVEQQLERLEQGLVSLRSVAKQRKHRLEQALEHVNHCAQQLAEAGVAAMEKELKQRLDRALTELDRCREAVELSMDNEERDHTVDREQEHAEETLVKWSKSAQQYSARKAELEAEISQHEQELDKLKNQGVALEADLAENELILQDLRMRLAVGEEQQKARKRALEPLQARVQEVRAVIAQHEAAILDHSRKAQEVQQEMARLEQEAQTAAEKIIKLSDELEALENEVTNAVESLSTLEQELVAQRRRLATVSEMANQQEMEVVKLQLRMEALADAIRSRYHLSLAEFMPDESLLRASLARATSMPVDRIGEIDWSQLAEILEQQREELDEVGTVNLTAIQEYEELSTRHAFIKSEQHDLLEARSELLRVMERLDEESKQRFLETFASVKGHFQTTFRKLFGGDGEARIELVEPDNPLECGIDISARPPGKKMQSISLLSGGERSMIAVALLFAIYQIKPSPFCVLDELDAPLDEANIGRFLKALDQFLTDSQFIIVTHNKRTMERADVLYGVSMEEAGASKVLSLRLDQ